MKRAFANADECRRFSDALEQMLRRGEAEGALAIVRERMQAWAPGLPVIDLALAARPEQLEIKGWDEMAKTVAREEARGKAITAIGIDFSSSSHFGLGPDAAGLMDPFIETNYFEDLSDMAFSTVDRASLLAGYEGGGTCWQGCFAEIDNAIGVGGMSALYGALAASRYRDRYLDDAAGDAHTLASCTSAILLHLAVRRMIETHGLPKPMAVLVGSNEDFPFFDAPVASIDEARALMPAPMPVPPAPVSELRESVSGSDVRNRLDLAGGSAPAKGLFARLLGR